MLATIQETWDAADYGMILGTTEFDTAVGKHTKGLEAMKRVVEHLSPQPDEVTVVLNYREPRIDQWVSVWWGRHEQELLEESKDLTYQEYMCDTDLLAKNEEIMETTMNPMGIAKSVVDQGWKVTLVDMTGVEKAGRDAPTVIACDVVGAVCDEGPNGKYLRNHPDHPFHENSTLLESTEALQNQDNVEAAERALLGRDCAYEPLLKGKVEVVHNASVWSTCHSFNDGAADGLRNAAVLFRALRSQVECEGLPAHKYSIDQYINGEVSTTMKKGGGGGGASHFFEGVMFPAMLLAAVGTLLYKMHTSRQTLSNPYNGRGNGAAVRESELGDFRDDDDDDDDDEGKFV